MIEAIHLVGTSLKGTDITGVEFNGIKITRDPHFERMNAKIDSTAQTTVTYGNQGDEGMWNSMHNPDENWEVG